MAAIEVSTSPTTLPAGFDAPLTVDAELGDALGTVVEGLIDLAKTTLRTSAPSGVARGPLLAKEH